MLERLVAEIRQGGTLQPSRLAGRLNVSVDLVNMMLEDLARRGLIAEVNAACGQPCRGCPLVGECVSANNQNRTWMLAGKKG